MGKRLCIKRMVSGILVLSLFITVSPITTEAAVKPKSAAKSVSITSAGLLLPKGSTKQLKATVSPSSASQKVIWTSNNKKVATVTSTGKVKGIGNGNARIYAKTSNGKKTYIKVKVGAKVTSITANVERISLEKGQSFTIKGGVLPKNAVIPEVKYYSSDEKIATVGLTNGQVVAKAVGVANLVIKATDGSGKKKTILIEVNTPSSVTKITSKDVTDNKVLLSNQTYGSLMIDKSVGNAEIRLSQVTVQNQLILSDGAAYQVIADRSKINEVLYENTDSITKLEAKSQLPMLKVDLETTVSNIWFRSSGQLIQSGTGMVGNVQVMPVANRTLEVNLEGLKSTLEVKTQEGAIADIRIKTCSLPKVILKGGGSGQKILLANATETVLNSSIQELQIDGKMDLILGVDIRKVMVNESAVQMSLEIIKGTNVQKMDLMANQTLIRGGGSINEVVVYGNYNIVETASTKVTADSNAVGTKAGDKEVQGGTSTIITGNIDLPIPDTDSKTS